MMHSISQENVGLVIFQETKVMGGIYTREWSGYRVAQPEAPSPHCSGIKVFYREVEKSTLEVLCLHGPNVAISQLATGWKRWHVVWCYIYPDDASTIENFVLAISRRPQGDELLVSANFNAYLYDPERTTRAGTISHWLEGNEHPLLPEVQYLVEGQAHIENTAQGPSGAIPN